METDSIQQEADSRTDACGAFFFNRTGQDQGAPGGKDFISQELEKREVVYCLGNDFFYTIDTNLLLHLHTF